MYILSKQPPYSNKQSLVCEFISFPPSNLTYKHTNWVVVFPQVTYLSLEQILALLRQGCSSVGGQSFSHLLQYRLPNPQQGLLQVSFPMEAETSVRATISSFHALYYRRMHLSTKSWECSKKRASIKLPLLCTDKIQSLALLFTIHIFFSLKWLRYNCISASFRTCAFMKMQIGAALHCLPDAGVNRLCSDC